MDVDAEKLEQAVLALLYLNTFDEKSRKRAWKALPWSVMDQLHDKGYISDPATKAKSVCLLIALGEKLKDPRAVPSLAAHLFDPDLHARYDALDGL